MEEFIVQVFSQFPTFAGLIWLSYIMRDELRMAREENRDNQHFIQSLLLLILEEDADPKAVSRARSVLRGKVDGIE